MSSVKIVKFHTTKKPKINPDKFLKWLDATEKEFDLKIPCFTASKNQMHQLLLNVCANAIDATPEAGRINLSTKQTEKQIEIKIADTGTGMSEETKKHIFEPFYTTKEIGKGIGLGLSVCYQIVRRYGGAIIVESEPGKGTAVTITFPLNTYK